MTQAAVSTNATPAMRQYFAVKEKHPDKIIFFRMGDFYEMFGEDAEKASSLLGIALTSRAHGQGDKIPLAGVPHHQAEKYLGRLLEAGERVVVVEQVEDPKTAKGVVKREITEILTPGTAPSVQKETDPNPRWLAALMPNGSGMGMAGLDLSTGQFLVDEGEANALVSRLKLLEPAEILIDSGDDRKGVIKEFGLSQWEKQFTSVDGWTFEFNAAQGELNRLFGTVTLDGFGVGDLKLGIGAAGAIVRYLRDTNRDKPAHINRVIRFDQLECMTLDYSTVRNLELVKGIASGTFEGSLLNEINYCVTQPGVRRLHAALLRPFRTKVRIERRLSGVSALVHDSKLRNQTRELLKELPDLERLAGRLGLRKLSPRAAGNIRDGLSIARKIKEQLSVSTSPLLSEIARALPNCDELITKLQTALAEDLPLVANKGNIFKRGFSTELDSLNDSIKDARQYIASLQATERERTGINTLKVGYNQVFGYYLETTRATANMVPSHYIRKQTLVNAERYITGELKEKEDLILGAEEKIFALETRLFETLVNELDNWIANISLTGDLLAELDLVAALAEVATIKGYKRPELYEDGRLEISDGRHPVVESVLPPGSFVANSITINADTDRIHILTGPNMAGKSTYLRQIGLIVILAQIGSFVPATGASVGIVDRVFTRVGASDNLVGGQSTFLVEMVEAANILHNATGRSLILLDEVGRGTSTYDGLSVAWAVVEYINEQIKARTVFATHYHELTGMAALDSHVHNYQVTVKKWQDELIFLHQIVPGGCDDSYGIEAARLAGLPKAAITRARQLLRLLETGKFVKQELSQKAYQEKHQPSLFEAPPSVIEEELRNLDLNNLTPVAALNLLEKWKAELS